MMTPSGAEEFDLAASGLILMSQIDELHLKHPLYGALQLTKQLFRDGFEVDRVHVAMSMRHIFNATEGGALDEFERVDMEKHSDLTEETKV